MGHGRKQIRLRIVEIRGRGLIPLFPTLGNPRRQAFSLVRHPRLNDGFVFGSGPKGPNVVDLEHDGYPFGALPGHVLPIPPQGNLQLVGNIPQTPLHEDFDLAFEPVENARLAVGDQQKLLERLQGRQAGLKQPIPAAMIAADAQPGASRRC